MALFRSIPGVHLSEATPLWYGKAYYLSLAMVVAFSVDDIGRNAIGFEFSDRGGASCYEVLCLGYEFEVMLKDDEF